MNVIKLIRRSFGFIRDFVRELYLLELFGALATTGLGWASARLLGMRPVNMLPFWFFSYLAVYNLDRLYADPADAMNTPLRTAWRERLRPKRWILIGWSMLAVGVWTLLAAGLGSVGIVLGGILALWFYSRPVPLVNFRLKDSLLFKSVGVPLVISISLVGFPLAMAGRLHWSSANVTVFLWCFLLLFTNGFVFDVRDRTGDRAYGTRTLPVVLGDRGSELVSFALGISLVWAAFSLPPSPAKNWPLTISVCGTYAVLLSVLWRHEISALALSFCADFLLVAPALCLVAWGRW